MTTVSKVSDVLSCPSKEFTHIEISTITLPFERSSLEPVDLVADSLAEADLEFLMSVVVLALEVRLVLRVADDPVPSAVLSHGVLDEVGCKLASSLKSSENGLASNFSTRKEA